MSGKNAERVRAGIGSLDVFWGMLDENVVWDLREFRLVVDLDPMYVGREAVIKASRHYFGAFSDDYTVEAEELIDAGSSVVLMMRETGHGRGSGVPVERSFAQVWTFSGEKVVRWAMFTDRAAALRAVGMDQ